MGLTSAVVPRGQLLRVVLPSLAVLGGWLMVLPGSVVVVALRLDQLGADATGYSLTLAAGWTVLVVSLIVCGRLGDRVRDRSGSRVMVGKLAMPVAAACAMFLASADSVVVLSSAWVALQVPAGALIATAVGLAADAAPVRRRGLMSGLVGIAPVLSVLVGSLFISALDPNIALASGLLILVGIALALPAMLMRSLSAMEPGAEVAARTRGTVAVFSRMWILFLLADFLLSWSTATGNGYLVLVLESLSGAVDDVATRATFLITVATGAAVVCALVAGLVSRRAVVAKSVFAAGTLAVGLGLVLTVMIPTDGGLAFAAVLFGAGFGAANGSEFAVALSIRGTVSSGSDLGLLNAVTSVPYILVPLVASMVLAGDEASGLLVLYVGGASLAVLGSGAAWLLLSSTRSAPLRESALR